MTLTKKYQMNNKIYESTNSIIYSGHNIKTHDDVIIKILNSDYPDLEKITRFKYEYEMLKDLSIDGVLNIIEVVDYKNSIALIREKFSGLPLSNESFKNFDLKTFLEIFIKITQVISNIHSNKIIHKDINPSNILWDKLTNEIRIIDFGISTRLTKETSEVYSPNVLEGTLDYISPEQTGRINRPMDYRSDLYSLGVTFYKLLTGRLPFKAHDPMEMVHMHIAKKATPVHILNPKIPEAISDIISKLMSKMSEDRYKTAFGVINDLQFSLIEYKKFGKIKNFVLGKNDFNDNFEISNKLYGRDTEIASLINAFNRVNNGISECVLISGYSGIGKSSLVREIYKPIAEKRGYFISGKFDQFKMNIPYSALIQAFQELIRQILTESENSVSEWKKEILEAIGTQGQVLINVIPDLELIIGSQEVITELASTESLNRFNLLFKNFIKVFADKTHPLVIFIDDLQWVDHASLKLIETFLNDSDCKYMLIIGAYRDNEVDEAHHLFNSIKELEKLYAPLSFIKLNKLQKNTVFDIISDNFPSDKEEIQKLTVICEAKTAGNPFFLKQFLKRLHENKILYYDFSLSKWTFEINEIKNTDITDNVVDLMVEKIQKIPLASQEILKLASCIGNQFELKTLSVVYESSTAKTARELWPILSEELIVPTSNIYKFAETLGDSANISYKFFHDKIQQAAYSMIEEDEKKYIHLKIARLLSENMNSEEIVENIFEITNHYNDALDLIIDGDEIQTLISLNFRAGKKAKLSGAYIPSLEYFHNAIRLTPEIGWKNDYDFTLKLYNEIAELCFLNGKYEQMTHYTDKIIANAKTTLDKVKAYESIINSCLANNTYIEGLNFAQTLLKELGLDLPIKPNTATILKYLLKTKLILKNSKVEELLLLPKMEDEKFLAIMKILSTILSLCYIASPNLFPIIVLTQINLSIKYGNTAFSAEAYALYGLILAGLLKDFNTAFRIGNTALKLSENKEYSQYRARVLFYTSNFVFHWKDKIENILPKVEESYTLALQNGDLEYGAWAAFLKCEYLMYSGQNLNELLNSFDLCEKNIAKLKQHKQLTYTNVFQNLLRLVSGKIDLTSYIEHSEKLLDGFNKINDAIGLYFIHYNDAVFYYSFGNHEKALESITLAEKYLESNLGSINYPIFYYRSSLILINEFNKNTSSKYNALKKIKKNQKLLKMWSENSPDNYKQKFEIIEAELARITGDQLKSIKKYNLAIKLSKESKNLIDEALANELAYKFYSKINYEQAAQLHLKEAHFCYKNLGYISKYEKLEDDFPETLLSHNTTVIRSTQSISSSSSKSVNNSTSFALLDLNSILKTSQALSGEIVLFKLLEKMMNYVAENAGASKGYFILEKNHELFIEASIDVESAKIEVLQSLPLKNDNDENLPSEIINYVLRTHENVVLNNASNERKFSNSGYIQRKKPKSLLCMPILNQNKLTGILYLENNLATEVFSENRIQILNILSSQLSISIQNSNMYSALESLNKNLEEKVQERTLELDRKNRKLTDSIDYAKKIQTIILPKIEDIKKQFDEFFIIYLPCDIVSGDFYWFRKIGKKSIFATIDCTGHGVPGGFLSMIGNTLLDKIVSDSQDLDPASILGRLHLEVRTTLRQTEVKDEFKQLKQLDGMDASLCIFEEGNNKVYFSGAKLPIYLLKNPTGKKELIRIKGDRKSIGGRQKEEFRIFTTKEIEVNKGDIIYMTSDGYADQNDNSNKRFGSQRFENIILNHSNQSMEHQKQVFLDELSDHMEGESQRDDITVIGIKI